MATIASINPFPHDLRTAFEAYTSSTTYSNREQFTNDKWHQMRCILDNPAAFIPHNKESSNLKTRTQSSCELISNKLYKQSDTRHLNPRYVVLKAEVFDIIAQEHLKLLHAGRKKFDLLLSNSTME